VTGRQGAPRIRIRALPLASLVEDPTVYPRHAVDEQYVGHLAEALRAGASLPPVLAAAGSRRLVDGWHRVRAYHRVLGASGVIDVELRTYPDEASLLFDAIACNASHGRKLDRIDQVRSVLLGEEAGLADEQIAVALRVTGDRLKRLRIRVALAPAPPGAAGATGEPENRTIKIALKRPVLHLAGKALTAEQVRAHETMPGSSFLLVSRQLRDAMKYGLVNETDARLLRGLRELQVELARFLEAHPPEPEEPQP
jgi:hypothetical protein